MKTNIDNYNLYSKFDIELHKQKYVNYLEVIIHSDGVVEYAVPSHQEKLIEICCKKLNVNRNELNKLCPEEYYFNFITWLCNVSGCISVWTDGFIKSDSHRLTIKQKSKLIKLKNNGLFKGEI